MPNVIVATTSEELSAIAGELFFEICNQAIADTDRFVVALSGGSTPRGLHQYLARAENRRKLDWSKGIFLWGDERTVPPDHPDSNFRMAHETLLVPLGISESQYHRMPADASDLDQAAQAYEATVIGLFDSLPPSIDLIILGMGDDGHTASLFPETQALKADARFIVANAVPQLKTSRMTMTYPLINAARNVLFLVQGRNKAERLVEVLHGPPEPQRLPSQRVCPTNGTLRWIIDTNAAAALPAE
jgi:6-phosphogluconolactonase